MELYDIIKSNEFLISVYAGLMLLISFILIKIRNQAKKKQAAKFKTSKQDKDLNRNKEEKEIVLNTTNQSSNSRIHTSINNAERYKKKFEVINKAPSVNYFSNSNFKLNPRFTEYYEGTNSKLMFKYKPSHSIE